MRPFFCAACVTAFLLITQPLTAQSVDQGAAEPYGGASIRFGELALPSSSSTPPVCPTGTNPNCVVTGQYSRGRLGQNALEQTLAGYGSGVPNNFTFINYYPTDTNDWYVNSLGQGATYNPIMAQPLWLNNVPFRGTNHNMLLAATLTGTVYAYDADSGTQLWNRYGSGNFSVGPPLVQNCGGITGTPVIAVFQAIPYFGILSTPVVDGAPADPIMYVVSGCQDVTNNVSYYLNAIDITTGGDLMNAPPGQTLGQAGGLKITGPAVFQPGNQFQRPALLLTHTKNAQGQIAATYLYISFGTAITELGSGSKGYNGWVFGYSLRYLTSGALSVTATPLNNSPFSTTPSNLTSGVYPAASGAAPGWAGHPTAYPSCARSGNCFNGDNWVDSTNTTGHGGGVWMAGRGPSADSRANVYFAAGNGAFGCTTLGNECTAVTGTGAINNFGESVVELAAGTVSPVDFYAPHTNHVVNDLYDNPFSAANSQVEALNRYDLDLGDSGVMLFTTSVSGGNQNWLATADKTGFVYVMPTLGSGSGSHGMGQFRIGDNGLTSGSYTTQAPFQMSRYPFSTGTTGICPKPQAWNNQFTSANCDQIMGFALWENSPNDYLLFAWPWNEPIIGYAGSATAGPPINFAFNTKIDPCPGWTPGTNCSSPGFPIGDQGYGGGKLAIAANGSSNATLWGTRYSKTTNRGELWGWAINTSPSISLTNIFSPTISQTNAAHCTGLPTLPSSWIPAKFAEPTLVNGKIYVPALEAFSSGTTIQKGGGVVVFGVCQ